MAVGSKNWLQEITDALPEGKHIIEPVQTFYDADSEYTPMSIKELDVSYGAGLFD